jgi:hypothetical protein|tara:strand:- start:871 stop:999 length:129 start_codon:yes stop_codon:yes gene_type:complete
MVIAVVDREQLSILTAESQCRTFDHVVDNFNLRIDTVDILRV